MCSSPDESKPGELSRAAGLCDRFVARQCCTTCAYRCPPDEKEGLMPIPGVCPKWKLRELSTWGGCRRYPKRQGKTKKQKENPE